MVARIHDVLAHRNTGGRRPVLGLYRRVLRIYRNHAALVEQVTCLHRPPIPEALSSRVVLVDDTLVPIGNRRTDGDTHLANYSGKSHKAGVITQVPSTLDGHLLTVSHPQPGRTHDRAATPSPGSTTYWPTHPPPATWPTKAHP